MEELKGSYRGVIEGIKGVRRRYAAFQRRR